MIGRQAATRGKTRSRESHRHPWMPAGVVSLALLLLALRPASAQETNTPFVPEVLSVPTNSWFPIGEALTYRIYWGHIPVGTTQIITEWAEHEGQRVLAIRYRTRSNKVIATLYPVDDTIESLIDPVSFRSIRFTKNLQEGHQRYHEVTTFDYTNLVAHWESKISGKTRIIPLEKDVRDLVAFMYLLRSQPFVPGTTRTFRVMADRKVYDLWVNAAERETLKLPNYGKVSCVRLEPDAAFEGLFVRKGKATVWVSDDERRLCTRITASVPVASIRIVLCEVHGPGEDAWIRNDKHNDADTDDPD